MAKVDYNIEYAHVYSDKTDISEEQLKSVKILKKTKKKLDKQGKTYTFSILVDEYHPTYHHIEDTEKYIRDIAKLGAPATYLAYESKLIAPAKIMIKTIPQEKIKIEEISEKFTINKKILVFKSKTNEIKLRDASMLKIFDHYTCTSLIAAWNLVRLEAIPSKNAIELTGLTKPKPFFAKRVINILPKHYKSNEKEAIEIIKASKYHNFADKIEYVYF